MSHFLRSDFHQSYYTENNNLRRNNFQREAARERECAICTNDINESMFHEISCGHSYCIYCLETMLKKAIEENSPFKIRCPDPECKVSILSDHELRRLRFAQDSVNQVFQMRVDIERMRLERSNLNRELEKEIEKLNPRERALFKESNKQCPKCSAIIQKNQGCTHMTCIACKYEFCWKCLGPYPHITLTCPNEYFNDLNFNVAPENQFEINVRRLNNFNFDDDSDFEDDSETEDIHINGNPNINIGGNWTPNNNNGGNWLPRPPANNFRAENNQNRNFNTRNYLELAKGGLVVFTLGVILCPKEKAINIYKYLLATKEKIKDKSSKAFKKLSHFLRFKKNQNSTENVVKSEKNKAEDINASIIN